MRRSHANATVGRIAVFGALVGMFAVGYETSNNADAARNSTSVYVTGRLNQLHVFNGATNSYIQAISGTSNNGQFNAIVASSNGARVYRTSMPENAVKVVDTLDDAVVDSIPVMGDPRSIQLSPDDQFLYVSNLSGSLRKIRLSDKSTVWSVTQGAGNYGMGVSADGQFLYVPNNSTHRVIKLDAATGAAVSSIPVGSGVRWVTVGGGYVVATNYDAHNVSVIDEATFTELGRVSTGTNPIGVVLDPSGSTAYVAAERSFRVEVIDLASRTLLRSVGLGTRPWGLDVTSDGSKIFVGTYQVNSLSVISTSQWSTSTIAITGDQSMTVAVADVPATAPTTTSTTTSTTSTTTSTTSTTTTTTVAPPTTTSVVPATTSTSLLPATTDVSTTTVVVPAEVAQVTTSVLPSPTPATMVPRRDDGPSNVAAVVDEEDASSSRAVAAAAPTTTTSVVPTTTIVPPPVAPDAAPGGSGAIIGGEAVVAQLSRRDNGLVISAGSLSATVYGESTDGSRIALDADGNLQLDQGDRVVVEGDGFEADSTVDIWLFSTPTRLGGLIASPTGRVSGSFPVPASLEPGAHRLVLEGSSADGKDAVIGVGLYVGDYDTASGINRWLIIVPLVLATILGLVIPTTVRRRRAQQLNG